MCGPLFLTVASFGLLSVGACLGFVTAALFAAGTQPAGLPQTQARGLDTGRFRRSGLAGSGEPLPARRMFGRRGEPFRGYGGRSPSATPRRRSVSGLLH
jgi:hypothetical protein